MSTLPYIPDLDRLFAIYNETVDSPYESQLSSNPYFAFLLDYGFLSISSQQIITTGEYDLHDGESQTENFLSFLLSQPEPRQILDMLEKNPASLEEIITTFSYEDDTIRVFVAWLERLNQIVLENGKFYINDQLTQDAENTESIYPFSYSTPLDISEDKFSVFEYLRKVDRNMIQLDPEFQRNLVWKPEQKSRFIESALLRLPIPPLYLKKRADGIMVIIDGLQRTTALSEFVANKFRLQGLEALEDLNGKTFKELQENESTQSFATRIEDKQLLFYILGPTVPMKIVYDIFNRINTGGTKLERQEVRNCVFIGKATRLLKELASDETFKKSTDNGISDKRMKAREAILRCISFTLFHYDDYQGSIDELLERAMKKLNTMSTIEIEDIKSKAIDTFAITYKIFGKHNFRIPSGENRGRINVALMEAVFNCFWERRQEYLFDHDILVKRFNEMVRDQKFLDSFRMSTSSKSGVRTRFSTAHKYLDYD